MIMMTVAQGEMVIVIAIICLMVVGYCLFYDILGNTPEDEDDDENDSNSPN